ncbi:MAG TPA: response regulator [Bacteroidia bacterium]|jgi:CheY-like chemotaxis protein|nr:response regulator [Bacteroidia bacterium]
MISNKCLSNYVFLADDDEDDRLFFEDALKEVCPEVLLFMAKDGLELMNILYKPPVPMPNVLFLDLNMPVKNGFECLEAIKKEDNLKELPIVIFSTTIQDDAVNRVYKNGANYYVCKPPGFSQLKSVIKKILHIDWLKEISQPPKEKFILSA